MNPAAPVEEAEAADAVPEALVVAPADVAVAKVVPADAADTVAAAEVEA